MSNLKNSRIIIFLGLALITLSSCEGMPGADARKYPPDPKKEYKRT